VTAAALERVQAHVLRPAHAHLTCSAFYFVKIDEPAGVRDLLRRLLDTPMTVSDAEARRQASQPPDHPYVAVGFTRPGGGRDRPILGRDDGEAGAPRRS
jgi:hypothetical protein